MNRRHFFTSLAGVSLAAVARAQNNAAAVAPVQLAWFDRTGKLIEKVGGPAVYRGLDLSPDGKRIAVHRHEKSGGDVWILDSGGETAITTDTDGTQENSMPIWSPDGNRVMYSSLRKGKWGLYMKRADGSGSEDILFESEGQKMPMSWSRDGKYVLYWTPATDLWILPIASDGAPFLFLQTPFTGQHAQLSPDGKFLVYVINENNAQQLFVRPFPRGTEKWAISNGVFPRWGGDGKTIYFLGAANNGAVRSVELQITGSSVKAADPVSLFDSGYTNLPHQGNYHTFAVSPDGQRFLIPRPL